MTGPVYLDLQAVQNRDYAERGVARHALEFARALGAVRPDLVGGLVFNPDLPVPEAAAALAPGKVAFSDALDASACLVYHVIAPFELEVPLGRIWPGSLARAGSRLVVTLHDLIPRAFPDHYHADPGLRRRYLAREEVVRAADRVLAVSEATRREAIALLGLSPARISVIGAGISPAFHPPASREEALFEAQQAVDRLQSGFLLYVGGADHRKNLEGLLAAYALLPRVLRARHQLVIACRLGEEVRGRLRALAKSLGIAPRVLFAGMVDDAALVALYQSTELFVFPSLSEGYGLPVAEALACGARVVASNTSATAEIAPVAGQFDPADPASIAGAMTRALEDAATRAALDEASSASPPTWAEAATRAARAYEALLGSPAGLPGAPAGGRRRTVRVGFVTPLPPQPTGVAVYSDRLLAALGNRIGAADGDDLRVEVDVFVDALEGGGMATLAHPPRAPSGMSLHPVEFLERVESARGGYDVMVYAIGNSEFHTGALAAARQRAGIVLAHDVSLPQLYAFAAHHGVLAQGFGDVVRAMYPERDDLGDLPDALLVDPTSFNALPVPMARELVAGSAAFLTTSAHAASLAQLDAAGLPGEGPKGRIGVLVHACRALPPRPLVPPGSAGEVVASFGVVNDAKDTARLIDAFARVVAARPAARLVFVGHGSDADLKAVAARADRAGIPGAVVATGAVRDAAWDAWLGSATIAVQLRRRSKGEFSGAVAEALAAGLPTIVAAVGAAADLPGEAVVKVPPGIAPEALAGEILALLSDHARQRDLGDAARRLAAARSFDAIAGELYAWIVNIAACPPPGGRR